MSFRHILLSCLLFVAIGCSAEDPTRHNTFIPLTSIEVTGTYASMADQTLNQYRAVGDFSGAFTRDITSDVFWRIEDENIASVTNTTGKEGLVTALQPGQTSITARYGDIDASAPVVVTNASLTAIAIYPQDLELQVGVTQQFEASGTFSDASEQDITELTAWQSSDTEVVTINSDGLATTQNKGLSNISASWQGIESGTSLLVTDATLTAITITQEEVTIAQGTTVQFVAEGTYSDDTTLDITDIVDWQSSDTGIGVVNPDGLATGVAPGKVEISASFEVEGGTISATALLTVSNAVIISISLSPVNSTIKDGATQQFTATGMFSDASEQEITDLATWVTRNNSVGTISNSPNSRGLFVSIDSGVTVIEATFGGVSNETLLTVE